MARKLIQREQECAWIRHVEGMVDMVKANEWKGAWRWLKRLVGSTMTLVRIPPVYDPDLPAGAPDRLITDPARVAEAWAKFFGKLVKDPDVPEGATPEAERRRWRVRNPLAKLPRYAGINDDLDWWEVCEALKSMKSGRAPGPDGIPPEVLKAAYEPSADRELLPKTVWGRVIFAALRRMWESGVVPESWAAANVVPIPKKGDLCDMDNYRGISLIATIVKLLCVILNRRLSDAAEAAGHLRREQAGFRRREECVGQACALYEVIRRNNINKLHVFACFVDFRKAYDMVPHGALFHRLHSLGIRGRALRLIQGLYAASSMRARLPGRLGPAVRVQRGVRQGCPLSPLLFDLYIDSILDECDGVGVSGGGDVQVPGLLFADDLVCLANTTEALGFMLSKVSAWADRWGMRIGAQKCGVMAFGSAAVDGQAEAQRWVNAVEWKLQGEAISVVQKYTYLGLDFSPELDLRVMAGARVDKGRKAMAALRPLLRNQHIPVPIRTRVLCSMVQPTLTFGGELFGMRIETVAKHQQVLSRGMRLIMGFSETSKLVSEAALWAELQISPVVAVVNHLRVRSFRKYPSLATTIGSLCKAPFVHRRRTWISGTRMWMSRFATKLGMSLAEFDRMALKEVKKRLGEWREKASPARGGKVFRENEYGKTAGYHRLALKNLAWGRPLQLLGRARMGALLTASRAAGMKLIHPRFKSVCPFCCSEIPETVTHLLVGCDAWVVPRSRFLSAPMAAANAAFESQLKRVAEGEVRVGGVAVRVPILNSNEVAVMLLGGESRGIAIPNWAGLPEKKNSKGDREVRVREEAKCEEPPCAKVAFFLSEVERRRRAKLDTLAKEFASEQRVGGAPVGADAGVNGDVGVVGGDGFPPRGDARQGMPGLLPAHAPAFAGD